MYKSITGNELQDKLVNEFMDSRYFGDQHWFAARAEIKALNEEINRLNGEAVKGSNPKSESVKSGK